MKNPPERVFTVGHSTRLVEEFLALLRRHGIQWVADARSIPRSKRNPQFNRETLSAAPAEAGIRYTHTPELAGFRRPRPDSPNTGWKNDSFRGFAPCPGSPHSRSLHAGRSPAFIARRAGAVAGPGGLHADG